MKLALIIALSPDRRSGRVLSDILPADQAIDKVKRVITDGACPDARFPIIRAISLDAKLREHRFRVSAADIAEDSQPADPSGAAFLGDLIPVEVGEGGQLVVINVTTEDEAKFLRDFAGAAISAIKEIPSLREKLTTALKAAEGAATANQRLAAYEADLKTKDNSLLDVGTQLAKCITEAGEKDARITELEARLSETVSDKARVKELEAQLAEALKPKKK